VAMVSPEEDNLGLFM